MHSAQPGCYDSESELGHHHSATRNTRTHTNRILTSHNRAQETERLRSENDNGPCSKRQARNNTYNSFDKHRRRPEVYPIPLSTAHEDCRVLAKLGGLTLLKQEFPILPLVSRQRQVSEGTSVQTVENVAEVSTLCTLTVCFTQHVEFLAFPFLRQIKN